MSAGPKYLLSVIESQGAQVGGTHFCIVSGFVDTIDKATKSTYCKDTRVPNSSWIQQDDLTDGLSIAGTLLSQGFSHAGHAAVGSKLYLCGGVSRTVCYALHDFIFGSTEADVSILLEFFSHSTLAVTLVRQ